MKDHALRILADHRTAPSRHAAPALRDLGLSALLDCLLVTLAQAETPSETRGIEAVRELKIESGTIQFLERDANPTPIINDHATENVPPRTVLKILLNPAKGSNINVEIWLPDAEKWNGRLIGLGNGGSAGSISASALLGQCSGSLQDSLARLFPLERPDSQKTSFYRPAKGQHPASGH